MSKALCVARPAGFTRGKLRIPGPKRVLAAIELATGTVALAGGALLTAAPDGSLLRANSAVLAGTPLSDWRLPSLLLTVLVGGGYLITGWRQWGNRWRARELSMLAAAGLVTFEAADPVNTRAPGSIRRGRGNRAAKPCQPLRPDPSRHRHERGPIAG